MLPPLPSPPLPSSFQTLSSPLAPSPFLLTYCLEEGFGLLAEEGRVDDRLVQDVVEQLLHVVCGPERGLRGRTRDTTCRLAQCACTGRRPEPPTEQTLPTIISYKTTPSAHQSTERP